MPQEMSFGKRIGFLKIVILTSSVTILSNIRELLLNLF